MKGKTPKRSAGKTRGTAKPEPPVTAREVRAGFGLSREKFARLAGASVRALANWESDALAPNESSRLRLVELSRLQRALSGVLREESIPTWLDTPNSGFDGLKPLEVIERGQIDRLWRMIFLLESGVAF
jgi:transcriptional regulator with XRE-family HTH domain